MSVPSLESILACPNLPTLPAVAWRVLELTRRPDVRLAEIADVVQNDPAIAARILKTINSSFYGLPSPCPSIARAIALLGLNAVKSLVLGFSLVDSVKKVNDDGAFDLSPFWRRTIHAAAAARELASATGEADPEEAFTTALLADVGMIALAMSCPSLSAELLQEADDDHARLARVERERLGFDHATISAGLAERWRLPAPLVLAVREHHSPAPTQPLSRLTALAALAVESLIGVDRAAARALLYRQAASWFRLDASSVDGMLPRIAEQASHIAGLFKVDAGEPVDVARLVEEASEQLAAHQVAMARESQSLRQSNDNLQRQATTDALTGARNRRFFDEALEEAFLAAASAGGRLAIIMCDGDHFKRVNDIHGHHAGDEVLAEMTKRFQSVVRQGDHVCRYGGEEFAIILPGAGRREAAALSERLRHRIATAPIVVHGPESEPRALPITASFGVAALDDDTRSTFTDAGQLLAAADRALYAAKGAGRNCTRVYLPAPTGGSPVTSSAGSPGASSTHGASAGSNGASRRHPTATDRWVLVVEDDPGFARLAEHALSGGGAVNVRVVPSGEAALVALTESGAPELVLADVQLPGLSGVELVRAVRSNDSLRAMPVIMVAGSPSDAVRRECFSAGANLYVSKGSLGDNAVSRLREIIDLWRAAA